MRPLSPMAAAPQHMAAAAAAAAAAGQRQLHRGLARAAEEGGRGAARAWMAVESDAAVAAGCNRNSIRNLLL